MTGRAAVRRPPRGTPLCRPCFLAAVEADVGDLTEAAALFRPGDVVAVGMSGGKDSTALAAILSTLNARRQWRLRLCLLAIDEGIAGYRDDSLEAATATAASLGLPLTVLSYKDLYGWSMDEVVARVGRVGNCTYCGVWRRQALERGAAFLGADVLATGHNADDMAETVLMNLLRGDIGRLRRCVDIKTGTGGAGGGAPMGCPLTAMRGQEVGAEGAVDLAAVVGGAGGRLRHPQERCPRAVPPPLPARQARHVWRMRRPSRMTVSPPEVEGAVRRVVVEGGGPPARPPRLCWRPRRQRQWLRNRRVVLPVAAVTVAVGVGPTLPPLLLSLHHLPPLPPPAVSPYPLPPTLPPHPLPPHPLSLTLRPHSLPWLSRVLSLRGAAFPLPALPPATPPASPLPGDPFPASNRSSTRTRRKLCSTATTGG